MDIAHFSFFLFNIKFFREIATSKFFSTFVVEDQQNDLGEEWGWEEGPVPLFLRDAATASLAVQIRTKEKVLYFCFLCSVVRDNAGSCVAQYEITTVIHHNLLEM